MVAISSTSCIRPTRASPRQTCIYAARFLGFGEAMTTLLVPSISLFILSTDHLLVQYGFGHRGRFGTSELFGKEAVKMSVVEGMKDDPKKFAIHTAATIQPELQCYV